MTARFYRKGWTRVPIGIFNRRACATPVLFGSADPIANPSTRDTLDRSILGARGPKRAPPAASRVFRLYWGRQFIETGWGKINNIPNVTAFFATLGIPFPGWDAQFIAGLELLGGILLVLGLGSRMTAVPLTINMLVAYITADHDALFAVISDPDKFYAAAAVFQFADEVRPSSPR